MDWHKIVGEILPEAWKAAPNITILIYAPFALLGAYYHLYTFWPFVLSLAAGLALGLSASDRKTT